MPHFCCIIGCRRKSNKHPGLSFYRLPRIPSQHHNGRKSKSLIAKRRNLWLSRISRAENSNPDHWKVCGRHFITGAPASLEDTNSPDWAPGLNLGHSGYISNEPQAMKSMVRYERLLKRKKGTEDTVIAAEALLQLDESPDQDSSPAEITGSGETQQQEHHDSGTKLYEAENDDQKSCSTRHMLLSHQAEEMSYWCIVPGCNGNYPSGPKVAVFSFPKDKELMDAWVKVISEYDFTPNNSSKVCEQHFQAEDLVRKAFVPQSKTGTKVKVSLQRPYLRYGAVPSMLLNQTSKKSSKSHSGKPVKTVQRLEGSDLDVAWVSNSYNKDSRLFFKNQHTDHWREFHYKTPVLSCMGRFNAVQRVQTSSNLPSFASSSSTNSSNTTPCSNTGSVEEEEEDFIHPASLLVPSKTKQLMKLLQKYRHTNTIPSNSSKKQQSPSSKEMRESPPVSVQDMKQTPSLPTISSEESKMRLLPNSMTVNIKDVTYIGVFSTHQENAISKYIMEANPLKKNGKQKPLAREDICKLVYHFCVSHNIPRPTLWNVHQAADMEWCKGFLRRYPCHEYDLFFSDDEDEETDFEGFEDRPNQIILQAQPCSDLDGDRLIQIEGLKWDHSYAVVNDVNK